MYVKSSTQSSKQMYSEIAHLWREANHVYKGDNKIGLAARPRELKEPGWSPGSLVLFRFLLITNLPTLWNIGGAQNPSVTTLLVPVTLAYLQTVDIAVERLSSYKLFHRGDPLSIKSPAARISCYFAFTMLLFYKSGSCPSMRSVVLSDDLAALIPPPLQAVG